MLLAQLPFIRQGLRRTLDTRIALALGLVLCWSIGDAAVGQPQLQRRAGPEVRVNPNPTAAPGVGHPGGPRVLIETSAPISNLFTRADEGIERADWKLAIDSLQRIIEDPEGSLLPRDDGECDGGSLYESARRRAIRRLASLPADGLAAYGLVYDGKAKGLYERAVAAHDVDALRGVVHRYLLTHWGDDAADVLASWALDEGRPGEVLSALRDVLELVPEFDVPRSRVLAKIAAAEAMTGRPDEAATTVEEFVRSLPASDPSIAWLRNIPKAADDSALGGSAKEGEELPEWSLASASGRRMGMPATSPTLVDPVPWKHEISRLTSYTWQRITDDEMDRPSIVAANEIVLDGTRVFARVPGGVISLDREDLGKIWDSTFRGAPTSSRAVTDDLGDEELEVRQTAQSVVDYAAGSLSTAHGLVFSVENEGRPRFLTANQTGNARQPTPVVNERATRIVARDVRTGVRRWHRGRTFDGSDSLGQVEFRGVPVAAGAELWVPVVSNTDLFLVALSPSDGAELHRLLLCSFPEGGPRERPALPVTAADGVVYVPSAFGALFAVDAATRSLRWAHRYGDGPPMSLDTNTGRMVQTTTLPSGGGSDASLWLEAPPVVVGGTVVLAPVGGEELLAFSATDGAFRWSTRCPGGSYVLAADVRRVWVGGRRLTCLSLQDGRVLWTADVKEIPTGRAALCGDRVLVPTAESLLAFDAGHGKLLGRSSIPSQQMPLGNLVCDGAALFSYEPSSVRKYPDLERAYAAAEVRRDADPLNVETTLRLAWIELFRGKPTRSRELLSRISDDAASSSARREEAVSHLRVETLLVLGADPAVSSHDGLTLLREAQRSARSTEDHWRVTTRIADRQRTNGEGFAAYQTLRDASLSPDANAIVQSEANVLTKARLDLGRRMRALETELTPEQVASFAQSARASFDEAVRSARLGATPEARRRLLAVAELATPKSQGAEALLELASMELAAGNDERGELLLGDCVRLDGSEQATLQALTRLVEENERREAGGPLKTTLQELERRFGSKPVPAALSRLAKVNEGSTPPATIGEFVRRRRQEMGNARRTEAAAAVPAADAGSAIPDEIIQPTWGVAVPSQKPAGIREAFAFSGDLKRAADSIGFASPRLVHFGGSARTLLGDRAVFHAPGDVLYCQRPEDGTLLWQTTLRAPESFADGLDVRRGKVSEGVRRAALDGEIGVFNGNEGLYGVGLLTGRRLWFHPLSVASEPGREFARDPRMDAQAGIVAAIAEPGHLLVLRLIDGSLLWERDLRGEPVDSLRLVDGVIVVIDKSRQRVHLFDAVEGRLIARVAFRQPDPENRVTELVISGGVICGPDCDANGDAVIAVDIKTGGARWRVPVAKPLAQLFEPSEDYLGIGLLGGDIQLVDAKSGEAVTERRVNIAQAVLDALVVDTSLIVRANTTQTGERRPMLVAIDITSGEELWRRTDLSVTPGMSIPLQMVDGGIPLVVEYQRVSASAAGLDPRCVGIAMVDAKTGVNRYLAAELVAPRIQHRPNGDFDVWPGVMIVGTGGGVMAYRTMEGGGK